MVSAFLCVILVQKRYGKSCSSRCIAAIQKNIQTGRDKGTFCIENEIRTVAFCCISTGEFHFPNDEAAEIAVKTVTDFLSSDIFLS